MWAKIKRWERGVEKLDGNLYVYYPPPVLIQYGHTRLNDRFNQIFIEKAICKVAERLDFKSPILWLYNPHAILPRGALGEKLVCYDCNDDMSSFARFRHKKKGLDTLEKSFLKRADVVFTTSKNLYNLKKESNPNTYYFPSGVDFHHFQKATYPSTNIPDDVRYLPRPIIGFIGGMSNSKLNWEWILKAATYNSEWSLVFVGPCLDNPPGEVLQRKNLFFLGQREIDRLPGYIKVFDVCIIPYKGEEFLKSCFPTKTFEYLAAGKPVVSADIPALRDLQPLVRVCKDADEFVTSVESFIKKGYSDEQRARCIEVSKKYTWDERVEKTSALVNDLLSKKLSL
jgi:glycosyltransferase involved in cell wall biosynthesis